MTKKQQENLDQVNSSAVMQNFQGFYGFILLGNQYSTNPNRIKEYSYDDEGWRVDSTKGLWWKIKTVFNKKARRLV